MKPIRSEDTVKGRSPSSLSSRQSLCSLVRFYDGGAGSYSSGSAVRVTAFFDRKACIVSPIRCLSHRSSNSEG